MGGGEIDIVTGSAQVGGAAILSNFFSPPFDGREKRGTSIFMKPSPPLLLSTWNKECKVFLPAKREKGGHTLAHSQEGWMDYSHGCLTSKR